MKKINVIQVITRLIKKFDLTEITGTPQELVLSEIVMPITDADEALATYELKTFTTAISATGWATVSTDVPYDEKWSICLVSFSRSTGNFLFSDLGIGDGTSRLILKSWPSPYVASGDSTSISPMKITAGMHFDLYCATYVGTGNVDLVVLLKKEKWIR